MRHVLLAVAALAAPLALTACKKPDAAAPGAAAKAEVKWPAKPADGAPIALVFKKFEGEGERKIGIFDLFNFGEGNLTRFVAKLEYLDASGKVIGGVPHTHMQVVGGKAVAEIKAGFGLPPETTAMRAVVRTTEHGAANKWAAPEPGAAPASEAPAAAASDAPAAAGSEAPAAAPASEGEGDGEAEGDAEEGAEAEGE
jgi:hypothetical protein